MARAPRRMSSEQRRDQLVAGAMALIAGAGEDGLTLDAVAERADVTRNLLYHYFPGGRRDLLVAAAERAGEELVSDWSDDPATNFARMVEHAMQPSDAWMAQRLSVGTADPRLHAARQGYLDRVVTAIARNNLGTDDPAPLARAALEAYVDAARVLLDHARERKLPVDEVTRVLVEQLRAIVAAVS